MKFFNASVLLVGLVLLGVQALFGQSYITLYGTDGVITDSVKLGWHPSATGDIDGALTFGSVTLTEKELPPEPPTFDFRSVTKSGIDNLGKGVQYNIHQLAGVAQTDTFKLQFKSDEANGPFTISWGNGFSAIGGGYWALVDPTSGTVLADLATGAGSYTYNLYGEDLITDLHWLYLVKGDGLAFRTATSHALAVSHDYKGGLGKLEKAKNYNSEAKFDFVTTAIDTPAQKLYIEFSQGVYTDIQINQTLGTGSVLPTSDGKTKKITFVFDTPLPIGTTVTVWAHGNAGKALLVKKFYFHPTDAQKATWPKGKWIVPKPTPPVGYETKLWLHNSNWTNVVFESYQAAGYTGANDGIRIGLKDAVGPDPVKAKPMIRYIYHPKYGDFLKTISKKGVEYPDNSYGCMKKTGKGAWIVKQLKSLPPDKAAASIGCTPTLVPELLALKFNLLISQYDYIPVGLGSVKMHAQAGDPAFVEGMTIDQLAALADSVLSCPNLLTDASTATLRVTDAEALTLVKRVNSTFCPTDGSFDTLSWGGVKTHPKPYKMLMEVDDLFYRDNLTVMAPAGDPNFRYVEAVPATFSLSQNYPNPFNPTTTIRFSLPEDAMVTLKVYNTLGQEVVTLLNNEEMTEGDNDVAFDASMLSSGVYYYRLVVNEGQFQQVKKMMLVK